MKKNSHIFSFLLLSLMLNSCFSTSGEDAFDKIDKLVAPLVKYDVVKIEDLYSMKVPDFMTVTTKLQEDASLQYNNPFKEKYVTVLAENTAEVIAFMEGYGVYDVSKSKLDNYVSTRLNYLAESGITIKNQTKIKSKMINGRKAFSTVIDASVPGVAEDITYFFTYIEGKEHCYMISSWTLFDRKNAYTEEVETMTTSFKEL